jgi:hypothetical protein
MRDGDARHDLAHLARACGQPFMQDHQRDDQGGNRQAETQNGEHVFV